MLSMEAMVAENAKLVRSALASMSDWSMRSPTSTTPSSVSEATPTRSRRRENIEEGSPGLSTQMNPALLRLIQDLALNKGGSLRVCS